MCDGSSSDIAASWPYCDPLYTLTACCEAYVGDGWDVTGWWSVVRGRWTGRG